MLSERKTLLIAAIIGASICLLPIIGFVLVALWPYKELVSWLILGSVGLVVLVWLTLRVIKTTTATTVAMHEQTLRPNRLHSHERLISDDSNFYDFVQKYPLQTQEAQRDMRSLYSRNAKYQQDNDQSFEYLKW